MKTRFKMLIGACLFLAACSESGNSGGGPNKGGESANTESALFSYEFELNGCKTGKHQFSSSTELCRGLQNNTLNNHCAIEIREDHFQNNCSGQTFVAFDEDRPASVGAKHDLQITALNFLLGGLEQCDVKDKIFTFAKNDKDREVLICRNSRVRVYAVSNSGVVSFHAADLLNGGELPAATDGGVQQRYELGKTLGMLRYRVQNPYGFTLVMAEDVTGIDPQLLAQWNQLSDRAATLRAQILIAQSQGETASKETLNELADLERQFQALAEKMRK